MGMQSSLLLGQISKENSWIRQAGIILGASFIISILGPVAIPLPFSPVPIAIQGHVILFLSLLLGGKRAALAVLAFLAQGAMGLPVFAGAKAGILHLAGPTGGYLFGYVLAAFVAGSLIERCKERSLKKTMLALAAGNLCMYLLGIPWLSLYVGFQKAMLLGMVPFLAGDFLKIVISLRALRTIRFFSLKN